MANSSPQIDERSYIFVGNRIFVLQEMLARQLKIKRIFAVRGSHLERQTKERNIPAEVVGSKSELLAALKSLHFDVLVSNGCPYLLPVDGYMNPTAELVNIHPSYLPDLPGKDPVPGSLMFERDSGATCHRIDAGIDTGPIIAQIRIPYTPDLDAGILYQLSFWAEREVFSAALNRDFLPSYTQNPTGDEIYYSRSAGDQRINFAADSCEEIVRKVTAFGNRSQGVNFAAGGHEFKTYAARLLSNPYLLDRVKGYRDGEVIFCYEDVVVLYKDAKVLKLERVCGPLEAIRARDILIV